MNIEPIHRTGDITSGPADPPNSKSPALRELEEFLTQAGAAGEEPRELRAWLDLAEAWKITKTLRECRGNRSAAARVLGIGRRTLYAKMEKLQIAPTWAVGGRTVED